MAEQLSEEEQIIGYREAFSIFHDDCGSLAIKDIKNVLRAVGEDPTDAELQEIINEVDDGSGVVERSEFLSLMEKRIRYKSIVEELIQECKKFDRDANGVISIREYLHVIYNCEKLTQEAVIAMEQETFVEGDGSIEYEEAIRASMPK